MSKTEVQRMPDNVGLKISRRHDGILDVAIDSMLGDIKATYTANYTPEQATALLAALLEDALENGQAEMWLSERGPAYRFPVPKEGK